MTVVQQDSIGHQDSRTSRQYGYDSKTVGHQDVHVQ